MQLLEAHEVVVFSVEVPVMGEVVDVPEEGFLLVFVDRAEDYVRFTPDVFVAIFAASFSVDFASARPREYCGGSVAGCCVSVVAI